MVLEGTRFANLENSIKRDIERKKSKSQGVRSDPSAASANKKRKAADDSDNKSTAAFRRKSQKKFESEAASRAHESTLSGDVSTEDGEFNNDRTVYLQGLPFTASEDDVRSFFAENNCADIISIRLPRWHDSGNLRGYGHVAFSNSDSAKKALDLDGYYLKNRYINIERPKTPRVLQMSQQRSNGSGSNAIATAAPPGCRTVFIKNLPYATNEEEIRKEFMVYGPIKTVRLAAWNHTGKLKGFGYVEYQREDSATVAVKKSGSVEIQGRRTLVDYETGAPKGGFKPLATKKR